LYSVTLYIDSLYSVQYSSKNLSRIVWILPDSLLQWVSRQSAGRLDMCSADRFSLVLRSVQMNSFPTGVSMTGVTREQMSMQAFRQLPTIRAAEDTGIPVYIGSVSDMAEHLSMDSECPAWVDDVTDHWYCAEHMLNMDNAWTTDQRMLRFTLYRTRTGFMARPTVYRCTMPLRAARCLFVALSNCSPEPNLDNGIHYTDEQIKILTTIRAISDPFVVDFCNAQNRKRGERVSTKLNSMRERTTVHHSTDGTANHGRGGKMFNPDRQRDGRVSNGLQLPDQILSEDDIEDACQRAFLMNNCSTLCRWFDPTDRGKAYLVARTVERVDNKVHVVDMETVSRRADQKNTVQNRKMKEIRFRCRETGHEFSIRSQSESYVRKFSEMTSLEGPLEHPISYEESTGIFGTFVQQKPTWIQIGQSSRPQEVVYTRALRNLKFIGVTLYTMLNRQSREKHVDLYMNTVRRTHDEYGKLNKFPLHEMMMDDSLNWTDNQLALLQSQIEHADHLSSMFPNVDQRNRRVALYNCLRKNGDADLGIAADHKFRRIKRSAYFARLKDLYKSLEKKMEDHVCMDECTMFQYTGQVPSHRRHGGLNHRRDS